MSSCLVLVLAACARAPHCDRLLVGGQIHQGSGVERAELAISDGRIVALVPPARAAAWRRAAGEVVELGGAHVYPGFTESHGHLTGYGAALEQVDLRGAQSVDDVVSRAENAALMMPPGSWVQGRGWDQNLWQDKEFPHHEALSRALPDHPALLRRVDGHAVLVNAAALAAAGITRATPDPPGGRIVRDSDGQPTGVLIDAAVDLIRLPEPSAADLERRIERAGEALAAYGFTSIHDAGTGSAELAALRRMEAGGRLPIRVWSMLEGSEGDLLDAELPGGPTVARDGMLTVRAVKLYADGALGSRGAWLSAPYSDAPTTAGLEVSSEEELASRIRRAGRAGFSPCVHAIGDAAVTRTLALFERELGGAGAALRPRIEHAQIVRPEDVPRFAALGVVAAVQPTHCTSDMPWAGDRLGVGRTPWAYRWRSLLDAGTRLSLGSDVPVESPDPRLGVWAAVTRRPPQGTGGPWNPAEALTLEEAIAGYTSWAAYAGGEESWRGTIAPGYAADLTVLERALGSEGEAGILQARVVRTVVAGRDMYVAGSGT